MKLQVGMGVCILSFLFIYITLIVIYLSFAATISTISLPSGAELLESYAGETAVASGFGVTSDSKL